MRYISDAPVLWNSLNGVICVYKPQRMPCRSLRNVLIGNIANDLNDLECRPPVKHRFTLNDTNNKLQIGPSFADNTSVVGPRYLPCDIRCTVASHVGRQTSGVTVLGINNGTNIARFLNESRLVRVYHVSGKLGVATDTYDIYGAVVERSTYHFVKHHIMDRVLSSMQAAHQRSNFTYMGVNMHSQAAYDLAVKGTVRPPDGKVPFVYSIKLILLEPPDFTIEVKCVNEHENYLKTLIHDIGMKVHSTAACTSVRCIRYGPFTLEHALLRNHWRLQPIFDNLSLCQRILCENKTLISQTPSSLIENSTNTFIESGEKEIVNSS